MILVINVPKRDICFWFFFYYSVPITTEYRFRFIFNDVDFYFYLHALQNAHDFFKKCEFW